MDKIYEHSDDLHVRSVVVYFNSEDGKLYADQDFTVGITAKVLKDLYFKGTLLIRESQYSKSFTRPTFFEECDDWSRVEINNVPMYSVEYERPTAS